MSAIGGAVPLTSALRSAKFTLAAATPDTARKASSTEATQPAQLIPEMESRM
jgi:hypothetical protein